MIGSFLSRALIMVFGYAYPAYECFKIVESAKPEIHQLLYWCRYWILVSIITICERLGDCLISWLPMYTEAKLAFFVYLWHHKTRGTPYVYESFFRPMVKNHEKEIDNTLLELRVRGGELALVYWEKAATYGQTKFLDILQYASSQSGLRLQSSRQERKLVTYKHSGIKPISQQSSTDEKMCVETDLNFNQQQEPSTEFGPTQNGNLDVSHQQKSTPNKESVHTKHRRFRFFKN